MKVGKTQAQVLASYATPLMRFGGASFLGLLYFTDWKLFLQYVPFYNTKFSEDKTE